MLKPGASCSLVLDTRWADSPECQVRFLEEPFVFCYIGSPAFPALTWALFPAAPLPFAIVLGRLWTQSVSWHMGQAKRRRERLGKKYGTREGSNKPKPYESLKIYRSAWSGKWAVGIQMPNGGLRCLDVFCNRETAELDANAAKSVLFNYDWSDLLSPEKWTLFIDEYSKVSTSMGVESDDEILMVASKTGVTPDQVNAQLRELGRLSDSIWYRNAKKT